MIYEGIYSKLPIFFQNILISLYGAKLYYERYINVDTEFVNRLLRDQWLTKQSILEEQNNQFIQLINHAWYTVPYYREVLQEYGISPNSIKSIDDISKLPILNKEIIRTRSSDLLSSSIDRRKTIILNTSGSTGKSLRISVDLESRRKAYAFVTRYHRWAGLSNSRNNVTFAGRTIIPQNHKTAVFWRYNAVMSNYLFSTYHMSEQNLPFYINKIKQIQPSYIDAYPSAVYILASYMKQHNISGIHPKAILTSGETLLEYQRDLIESIFKCRIFDQYGCTEQALFVSQCENGTYHVHPEFGYVEILDDNNLPVQEGQIGRVVCTSFMNMAMPLIRYDLGDTAMMGSMNCCCRRHFPILEKLCGRIDDYIITSDGNKVGRLDPIFKGLSSVKSAQIIQTDYAKIIVKIVPGEEFDYNSKNKIIYELTKRVGHGMEIEIIIVNEIELSANGKYRAVICNIDK